MKQEQRSDLARGVQQVSGLRRRGEGRLWTVTQLSGSGHKWSDCRYTPILSVAASPEHWALRGLRQGPTDTPPHTHTLSEKCCFVHVNNWESGHRTGPRGVNCALQSKGLDSNSTRATSSAILGKLLSSPNVSISSLYVQGCE